MSIKFNYLYRDASNFKKWASVVFANPEGLSVDDIGDSLRNNFLSDQLFIAHQIRIPQAFLFAQYPLTVDDHCFHEFYSVEPASDAANDTFDRSILGFIVEVHTEACLGWAPFDPQYSPLSTSQKCAPAAAGG
jgi:hypothetical protein